MRKHSRTGNNAGQKPRARLVHRVVMLSGIGICGALATALIQSTPQASIAPSEAVAPNTAAAGAEGVFDTKRFQAMSTSERTAAVEAIIRAKLASQKATAKDNQTDTAKTVRKVASVQPTSLTPETAQTAEPTKPATKVNAEAAETPAAEAKMTKPVAAATEMAIEQARLSPAEAVALEKLSIALTARMEQMRVALAEATGEPADNVPEFAFTEEETADENETGLELASLSPALAAVPVPTKRPKDLQVPKRATRSAAPSSVMAYAPATAMPDAEDESNVFNGLKKIFKGSATGMPGPNSGVAVYVISDATVHMPDGTKLEAHSGIGKMMDDPRYVFKKNLGPTPPNIYKLRMRESRFYGVEAIRMLPQDRAAMRGRDGMLTHTNLLRSGRIGSHGCVAFMKYDKFLNAFKRGDVHTMVVVRDKGELPTYMAKL